MRTLLAVLFLTFSFSALSDVKVTSFYWVNGNNHLAEICGVVQNSTAPSFVKIMVDYRGNRPAVYNVVAGADGKFCQAVISYRGEAEASVMNTAFKATAIIK